MVEAHSVLRKMVIGKFCMKCKRFIPGQGVKIDSREDVE